jgi:hypothetical protein
MRICLSSYKRLSKAVLKASSLSSTHRGSSLGVCKHCRSSVKSSVAWVNSDPE